MDNAAQGAAREALTFWYGCNMLRHGELIRGCRDIMQALGFDVFPVGGVDYCCGSVKDANQAAAEGMASRTVAKFGAMQRARVIAWCPSCHTHMHDFAEKALAPQFSVTYVIDLLYEHREALAKLLAQPVPLRVFLHRHAGFNEISEVNRKGAALLRLIPSLELVEHDVVLPGYMCSSQFASVPGALRAVVERTMAGVKASQADAVVTLFHSCHREACQLETEGLTSVYNYIHLFLRAMGRPFTDEYKDWRKAGANAAQAVGAQKIALVGAEFFNKAILPELAGRPTDKLSTPK